VAFGQSNVAFGEVILFTNLSQVPLVPVCVKRVDLSRVALLVLLA